MTEEHPPYETDREYPEPARRQGKPGIIFPIILIGIGAVVLLSNLGIVDVSWQALMRFWPVLLILFGLDVIFGRRSFVGSMVVGLAALIALGGVLWISSSPERLGSFGIQETEWGEQVSGQITEPLQSIEQLEVTVDLSAAELEIGAQSGNQYAVQGDYVTDSALKPNVQYDVSGDTGDLTITQSNDGFSFPWNWTDQNRVSLNLPTDIPINLTVVGDMGGQTLDLTKLDIRSLSVENSSGQVTVVLPQSAEMDSINISADLGAITVSAPDGATINARDIHITNGSGAVTMDLPSQGSLGDVSIDADLGAINIIAPDNASLDMRSFDVENGSGAVNIALPANGSLGDVSVNADLGEIVIGIAGDLGDLRAESFTIDNGSGAVRVTLPNQGDYEATISADMGGVTVTMPDALEAHAEISTDMGSTTIDNSRFNKVDDEIWETADFAGAANRVQLTVKTGSGGVTIK